MPERKRKQPVVVALRPDLSHDLIAERAYYLWLARNCPLTDGTDDWFAAKAELEAELRPTSRRSNRRVTG
jgi:hypothetical protein